MQGSATEADDQRRRLLLLQLLQRSPYRRALRGEQDRLSAAALQNAPVRGALDAILADPDYQALGRVDRRRHARPVAVIRHLFEWVYFASDSFVERARRG